MLSDFDVEIVERGYGKNYVRLLHVKREGSKHFIKELEVNTNITLSDDKDFLKADNSSVVATDTQKNTVYVLAKRNGISSIEKFGMELSQHFLSQYNHVISARIHIEEAPWQRVEQGGVKHVHSFIAKGDATRFCDVSQEKHGSPKVSSGLKNMKIMKTTQSAFVNFHRDEYRSLPDMDDRIFCTVVECRWWYDKLQGLDFDFAWETIKTTILDEFAGPPSTGVFSPSVQNTLYLAEKSALNKITQVGKIEMVLPNVHAYEYDFKKLPHVGITSNNQVFQPVAKPSGNIRAVLQRRQKSKL